MSQDSLIILLFKIVLVSGALSVAAFVVRYHQMTKGAVWANEVGKTIVVKDILLIACLIPSILSLFFRFSRLTSHVAAWLDVVLFGLLTPVMIWRIVVWQRIHRNKQGASAAEQEEDAKP